MHLVLYVYPPYRIPSDMRDDYSQRFEIFVARCDSHAVLSSKECRLTPSSWEFRLPDQEKAMAHAAQMATSFGLRYWRTPPDDASLRECD